MSQQLMNQSQRKLKLGELSVVSSVFKDFLEQNGVERIYHVDDKVCIFQPETLPDGKVLKFVISPPSLRGKQEKRALTPALETLVRRGAANQYFLQDVEGVQKLGSPNFYEGISGLLGPFDYIEGVNLAHPKFRNLVKQFGYGFAMDLIQRADEILKEVHDRGIMHLDIKPGNIVYSMKKLKVGVEIIDWSLASTFYQAEMDLENSFSNGTMQYANEEHTYSRGHSRDYFALAFTLAHCLLPLTPEDFNLKNWAEFYYNPDWEIPVLTTEEKLNESYSHPVGKYFLELVSRSLEYDKNDRKCQLPDPRIRLPKPVIPRDFVPNGSDTCDLQQD